MKNYIGIDIGGTKCAVVLGGENGEILDCVRFPTVGVSETIERILTECENMKSSAQFPVVSIGISCGGPLDPKQGIILSPPNLPGWDKIEIVKMVEERIGVPAVLCNDANACALAEWQFGAGRGSENMVFLTFGTGLGAGIIINGKIYNGANGNAGEVGHVRMSEFGPVGYGKEGSLEGFASGAGIAMMAKTAAIEKLQRGENTAYCRSYTELDSVTAKTVAIAAKEGDETAVSVYERCGRMFGKGLSILVDILNPEVIVIGSIYQRDGALLKDAIDKSMREECLAASYSAVRVVAAELGDDIGNRAALSLAMSIG